MILRAILAPVQEKQGKVCFYTSTSDDKKHNEHQEVGFVGGLPGEIRALLTPSKIALGPKKLRQKLRKMGKDFNGEPLFITNALKKSLMAYVKSERKKAVKAQIGDSRRGTYGSLHAQLVHHTKESLIERRGFSEHTPYLLGPPLIVPENDLITMAWSTENLLLNAYRQQCFGLPSLVCIDTTHRLIQESATPQSLDSPPSPPTQCSLPS